MTSGGGVARIRRRSCKALSRGRARRRLAGLCEAAQAVDERDPAAVRRYFESNFTPCRVSGDDGSDSGLVTGYYEPLLSGSRIASSAYPMPLYAPPDDLLVVDLAVFILN